MWCDGLIWRGKRHNRAWAASYLWRIFPCRSSVKQETSAPSRHATVSCRARGSFSRAYAYRQHHRRILSPDRQLKLARWKVASSEGTRPEQSAFTSVLLRRFSAFFPGVKTLQFWETFVILDLRVKRRHASLHQPVRSPRSASQRGFSSEPFSPKRPPSVHKLSLQHWYNREVFLHELFHISTRQLLSVAVSVTYPLVSIGLVEDCPWNT